MRRQQLSEAQITALLDPPTDQRELGRHYTLSAADLAAIRRCRGDCNRLGHALMLCYLRYPGRPLKAGEGIYREGNRASSKAKPRRDATFVPRSSERLICRCRGQIGPESDGEATASTRSHKASGHPGLAGDGPAMPSAQRLTNEHL